MAWDMEETNRNGEKQKSPSPPALDQDLWKQHFWFLECFSTSPLRNLGPLSEFMALFVFCATVFSSVEVCYCFLLELSFLLEQPCFSHVLLHSLSLPFIFLFRFLLSLFDSSGSFSRHPVYFSSYLFLICVIWPFLSALLGMYTKLFLYLHLLFLLPSTAPNVHQWNPRAGNGSRHPQAHRSWYNKRAKFTFIVQVWTASSHQDV